MQDRAAPSQDPSTPFTLRAAAEVLGISLNTLRRRIAAGQVKAERVERPQGFVWQVYLDGAAPSQVNGSDGTVQRDGAGTVQQPPTDIMRAEAMAAYTRSLLEPLVAHAAELEGAVRELERENGRLVAELAAAQAQIDTHRTPQDRRSPRAVYRATQPGPPSLARCGVALWLVTGHARCV